MRATIKDAPAVLNMNDKAMWVLGFNAALEAAAAKPWPFTGIRGGLAISDSDEQDSPDDAGVAAAAPTLTEEEREHIHAAIEMLGDYEATAREHGNDSIAAGANATRYVLGKLFRFLPACNAGVRVTGDVQTRNAVAAYMVGAGMELKVADEAAPVLIRYITTGEWTDGVKEVPRG